MKKMNKAFAALMAMLLAFALAGCSGSSEPAGNNFYPAFQTPAAANPTPGHSATAPETSAPPADGSSTGSAPEGAANTGNPEPSAGSSSGSTDSTWHERYERIWGNTDKPSASPESPMPSTDDTVDNADMGSVDAVAVLGELVGTGRFPNRESHDVVDVTDGHNPYDMVWEYGFEDDYSRTKVHFGDLYKSYVDAVDWSMVFDAEYYKLAFPMLAIQYHDDNDLLLEHFQTVGVHEGRQGCEGFNVAAYMSVCGEDLLDAFDDNYECYYFYYMLNHDVEKGLDTSAAYGEYPLWLDLELTLAQEYELNDVNKYREELGVAPLTLHPENIAFANYRAWTNAEYTLEGHGWLDDDDNTDPVFDALGVSYLGENTVTKMHGATLNYSLMPYSYRYWKSKPHYEAMVSSSYVSLGVSHMYCDPDEGLIVQFDTFLKTDPVPPLGQ